MIFTQVGGRGAGNWLAGGHTYVISARALDVLCEAWPVLDDPGALVRLRTTAIFEDLVVGNALEARGIKPVKAHYGAECAKRGSGSAGTTPDDHRSVDRSSTSTPAVVSSPS